MQRKCLRRVGITLGFLMLLGGLFAVNSSGASASFSVPDRMDWWYNARFGMFIHFGSYSYLGHGEWVYSTEKWTKANYQTQISSKFNPVNFDAAAIVKYAKAAGQKYIVITAKHHEGLAMWNSQVASFTDYTGSTLYNLYHYTPFKTSGRDILMELKKACEAAGLKFCLYYSIVDWSHSSQSEGGFTTMASMTARVNYITDMKAQIKELIETYHPAVLWFDGDWTYNSGSPTLSSWWTKSDGAALYYYVMGLDPDLIVNERVCRGFELGDFDCPEETVPKTPRSRPWETCQTMNGAWGYNSAYESKYRSVASMVQELVTVVSRDGNWLINIGPKGDGAMTSGQKTLLSGIGTWMDIHSDSIYGATGTPFAASSSFNEPSWGRYTKKAGKLFAQVFSWPTIRKLTISGISNPIHKIYLLNDPNTLLSYSWNGSDIDIAIPTSAPDDRVSVVCVECTGVPTAGTPSLTSTPTATVTPSATPTQPQPPQ